MIGLPAPDFIEASRPTYQIKDLSKQSGWLFYHGTSSGMVTSGGKPSNFEYAHRSPPPKSWNDKLEYCLENHPPLSVGRIINNDQNSTRELWAPVGLILEDGIVVGSGGHITGQDGRLIRANGGDSFPYDPLINPEDFRKGPHAVYELGVEKPKFSGIYICPSKVKTTGDEENYFNLKETAREIAKKHILPLYQIDIDGRVEEI